MLDTTKLRTVRQCAAERPAFTEPQLRWAIFNAAKTGLDRAVVRVGRRVLIDVAQFDRWVESQGGQDAAR